ncbi:hypothetical protein [Dongia rigui]|nr:hypothetical protein [Dongia rigui]
MDAGRPVELGEKGEEVCRAFMDAVLRAVDGSAKKANLEFKGGDGHRIEQPLLPPLSNANADIIHEAASYVYERQQKGDYRSFKLISRADDKYVLAVVWERGGQTTQYYFELTSWLKLRMAN